MSAAPPFLALSDDLTGAVACAAELRSAGWPVSVAHWSDPSALMGRPCVVIDTNSRQLSPTDARDRVHTVLRRAPRVDDGAWVYKRVDSGLRGHVSTELQAVADVLGRPIAAAVAAPALGLATRGARQGMADQPLAATVYGDDPDAAPTDNLLELVRRPAVSVSLEQLRAGAVPIDHWLAGSFNVVFDAETPEDLQLVAAALRGYEHRFCLVGSVGLAGALHLPMLAPPRPGCLVVLGSMKQTACAQADALVAADPAIEQVLVGNGPVPVEQAAAALAAGRDVIVHARSGTPARPAPEVARALAETAHQVITAQRPAAVITVGGETASALWAEMGASSLSVEAVPWPTVPVLRLTHGPHGGLLLLAKSGAVGDAHWLFEALAAARALQRPEERTTS